MTRLWTLGQTGCRFLKSGLLPYLVFTFIFRKKKSNPVIVTANKQTTTERTQILKAGIWVQGMPLADSAAGHKSFDP